MFRLKKNENPLLTVISHNDCVDHEIFDKEHPETPARIRSVWQGLSSLSDELNVDFIAPKSCKLSELYTVHPKEYLDRLESCCLAAKPWFMSADCAVSEDSFRAIRASASCALESANLLLKHSPSFTMVRPPGHHAGPETAEGFCFINHIAIAIDKIRQTEPDKNFLIIDFDVHHGNGIDTFYSADPHAFYFSIHGSPAHIYPHTGYADEKGQEKGYGFTKNITLALGAVREEWMEQFRLGLNEVLKSFQPDYILVAAGFDAHVQDPYGLMNLEDQDYFDMFTMIWDGAQKHSNGALALYLEGGYSVDVLERLVPKMVEYWADLQKSLHA